MPKLEFTRADVADLKAAHAKALEMMREDPQPTDPEDILARKAADAGLRVLIGVAEIALDREAGERAAATDALR